MLQKSFEFKNKNAIKRKMSYDSLPNDLKNLIADFSWQITAQVMHTDLQLCTEIKDMHLHVLFLRKNVWCRRSRRYVPSPLDVFRPISWFNNGWRSLFDWLVVTEFLHRLDFRKRVVRSTGTRAQWIKRVSNWRNLLLLDTFFKILLTVPQDPFKPTYKDERFSGIKWLWN